VLGKRTGKMPVPQKFFVIVERAGEPVLGKRTGKMPVPQKFFCYCGTGRRARSIFFGKLTAKKL